ncbi:MAG: hypothetical protein JNK77_17945 [Saprospiraceae bacterium]|nr:hypothetical protein [Saprospiraceae bacterium]
MHSSLLLQILEKLSKRDWRQLHKWVHSDIVQQRDDVRRLFDYLSDALRHPVKESLERHRVFEAVFPGQPFDDDLLRLLMHFLLNIVKQYLAYDDWSGDTAEVNWRECRALRRREADKLFEKEWEQATQALQQQPFRNGDYHRQWYRLHFERYEYDHRQRRSGPMNLQGMLDELTHSYVADLLRHCCTILTYQSVNPQPYNFALLEAALAQIEQPGYQPTPVIAVYHCAYRALQSPEDDNRFLQFGTLITQHWQLFPAHEIRDLYLLAINYCIRRLNRGERRFIAEAFALYRDALEKEVLLEDGLLSKFTYNNILMLAIAQEDWDWADRFLDDYKQRLPARERENAYRYNRAVYFFRRPDYTKAMELLMHVEFRDLLYNLNARSMLLRIYYELGEYMALESHLDSFRNFLRRRAGLGYHRENYANLLKMVQKMLRSDLRKPNVRAALLEEAGQLRALAEREWLISVLRPSGD